MDFENHYETLGIKPNANESEIKQAFRSLAQRYHPDVASADPGAGAKYAKIAKAYNILSNPSNKREYDRTHGFEDVTDIRRRKASIRSRNDFSSSLVQKLRRQVAEGNLSSLASGGLRTTASVEEANRQRAEEESMQSGFWGSIFGKKEKEQVVRVNNIVELTFMEAMLGTNKYVDTMIGGEPTRLNVHVPAGIGDGATITVRTTTAHMQLKTVALPVVVESNKFLSRNGNDLIVSVPITIGEAILGTEIRIPTADGDVVKMKVAQLSLGGKKMRIRGRGFKSKGSGERGDVYIVLDIVAPHLGMESILEAVAMLERSYNRNVREEYSEAIRKGEEY